MAGNERATVQAQRDIIAALALASPPHMEAAFGDGAAHCIEASEVGALALQGRGIPVDVVACGAVARSSDGATTAYLGLDEETAQADAPGLALDTSSALGKAHPFHFVILATLADGVHVFCDLTAWQIMKHTDGAIRVPPTVVQDVAPGKYPAWRGTDGALLRYLACPYPDEVMVELDGPGPSPGFVKDLDMFIDLALKCRLDAERFHRTFYAGLAKFRAAHGSR